MKTWTVFTKEMQTKMEILLSSKVGFKTRSICREKTKREGVLILVK